MRMALIRERNGDWRRQRKCIGFVLEYCVHVHKLRESLATFNAPTFFILYCPAAVAWNAVLG